MATKAPRNGIYTLNGSRFRIRAGDPLPDGAVMDERRKQGPAPENRKLDGAPENRNAGGDSAPKDPLGELSDEAYDALTPAEKGARTRQANDAKQAASDANDPGDTSDQQGGQQEGE